MTSGDLFGTREYLKNNYLYRMAAAVLGIFGNSKLEAMYPIYLSDAEGQKLDGAKSRYAIRFAPGQLPPVSAFWSLTMYELPSSLLVANPLNRYLLNSPMLPLFKTDADGGLTLLIQHESWRGQGIQLAARAQGPVLHGHAPLLAESRSDRGDMDPAGAQPGAIGQSREPARARWWRPILPGSADHEGLLRALVQLLTHP